MALNPQQARKILDADAINIARKVADGKTLTRQERERVESVAAGDPAVTLPPLAKNQVELANIIGVTRLTIHRWLKEPGCPGRSSNGAYRVQEWLEFARARGHDTGDGETQTNLKAEQIKLQNEKLELQIRVLQKEYVATVDVERWGAALGMEIKKVVQQLHSIAPSIVGLSAAEAESRLREVEDEIMSKIHLIDDRIATLKPTTETM